MGLILLNFVLWFLISLNQSDAKQNPIMTWLPTFPCVFGSWLVFNLSFHKLLCHDWLLWLLWYSIEKHSIINRKWFGDHNLLMLRGNLLLHKLILNNNRWLHTLNHFSSLIKSRSVWLNKVLLKFFTLNALGK